jgi:MoxR-like ATPase
MHYGIKGNKELPSFDRNENTNHPSNYIASPALEDAVNVALMLGQPLLITGDPGTGKTQLAYHLADFFKLGEPLVFNAQTNSVVNDLFYAYDALGHFHYSQNSGNSLLTQLEIEKKFIKYQALGAAIESGENKVVLIDEIDKAPRDLPNDLLGAIEQLTFNVKELKDKEPIKTTKDKRPIIIITSNSEKNLPDAFLRRVIYYHIPFPDRDTLLKILNKKFNLVEDDKQLEGFIVHFEEIRKLKLKKDPATAELIYWVLYLSKCNISFNALGDLDIIADAEAEKIAEDTLKTSYSILAKNQDDLKTLHRWLSSTK